MHFLLKLIPSSFSIDTLSAAANEPHVTAVGDTLTWPAIDAISINLYNDSGEFLETIPGNSTQWTVPEPGGYFLVGADHNDWLSWGKSNVVQVCGRLFGDRNQPTND